MFQRVEARYATTTVIVPIINMSNWSIRIDPHETVDSVSAFEWVNALNRKFSIALPVTSPASIVTYYFIYV